MVNFNSEIISGQSIGDIFIGDNIDGYLSEMYSNHKINTRKYGVPKEKNRIVYIIDNTIKVITDDFGKIISLGCNEGYKGHYKSILYAGQEMKNIKEKTLRQRIFNGSIIINDDFGFSFVIPPPYDELADSIEDMPGDLLLKEIYVGDFSLWNPQNLICK